MLFVSAMDLLQGSPISVDSPEGNDLPVMFGSLSKFALTNKGQGKTWTPQRMKLDKLEEILKY